MDLSASPRALLARLRPRAFLRYAVVGATQNLVLYLASLGLVALGWTGWQALALMYPIAVCLTFLVNKVWSFEGSAVREAQFRRYVATYLAAYPVSVGLLWVLEAMGLPTWFATLATIGAIAAGLFLILNFLVFPAKRD